MIYNWNFLKKEFRIGQINSVNHLEKILFVKQYINIGKKGTSLVFAPNATSDIFFPVLFSKVYGPQFKLNKTGTIPSKIWKLVQ